MKAPFSYAVPMVFLWFSHFSFGFPMVFQTFLFDLQKPKTGTLHHDIAFVRQELSSLAWSLASLRWMHEGLLEAVPGNQRKPWEKP